MDDRTETQWDDKELNVIQNNMRQEIVESYDHLGDVSYKKKCEWLTKRRQRRMIQSQTLRVATGNRKL